MEMIDHAYVLTTEYINQMPKAQRKQYGQFFTSKETAVFMAGLFAIPEDRSSLSVLDPGAGSGSLTDAAYSFHILSRCRINMILSDDFLSEYSFQMYINSSLKI